MAEFNQYNLYSYVAGNLQGATDDKILVDLQRFKSIHDLDEVKDYVDKVFSEFEEQKPFQFPNDVTVMIAKEENKVDVIAVQKGKQIYGNRWYREVKD